MYNVNVNRLAKDWYDKEPISGKLLGVNRNNERLYTSMKKTLVSTVILGFVRSWFIC